MTTRRLVLLLVLASIAAACAAPGGSDQSASSNGSAAASARGSTTDAAADAPAGSARSVTVVLDWTPNTNHAGMYLAQANGWYADAGLEVEIIQPGEQGGLPALASGDADIAVSVQEEIVPARAQGAPVVSIAAVLASNTSAMLALADEGITRPRDLVGHRYGGFGGQLETALVRALVECDGGDPDAVEFVEVGNVDYRAGLQRDFYDFVWIFEGWDGVRLRAIEDFDVVTLPLSEHFDCIPDWYTPLLATSERAIAERPEVIADFMAATARGYEAAAADPRAAADALLAAAPELDETLVRDSAEYLAERYAAPGQRWGQQRGSVWQDFTDFLEQAGLVDAGVDVDAAYTNQFLPR